MSRDELERVEGPNLVLRLIMPADADYVFGLRSDPAYNAHLSEVNGTVEDQRLWIEAYKARESQKKELYYVIERKDGVRCGLVRLYDIGEDSFTWGSWILDHNKPQKAALESAILSFGVGFELLDLDRAFLDVRRANAKAINFYLRLGTVQIHEDDQDLFFTYSRAQYDASRANHMEVLEYENQA